MTPSNITGDSFKSSSNQNVSVSVKGTARIRESLPQKSLPKYNLEEVDKEYESDSIEYYKMLSAEFDYDEVKNSDNFVVIQYDDSVYRGQVEKLGSKIRHGYGVVVYKNKISVNAQTIESP